MTIPDLTADFARVPLAPRGEKTGPKEIACLECGLLALPWEVHDLWKLHVVPNEEDVNRPHVLGGFERWACLLCRRLFVVDWSVAAE